jgi:amidase
LARLYTGNVALPLMTGQSASELARLVKTRNVSATEVVNAHLGQIETLNPVLNAFIGVDAERAGTDAAAADAALRRGESVGALHGVPISIKSSIEVAGLPWETGSASRRGVRGTRDATLVARARRAGAIVLGVTNVAEQLMAWETDNPLYGPTNNPWDLSRTPGGSSGGESAAIAAGLSAGGVGSDGGGSIRVPAHFTGICGLKPTPGRVPATGHYPVCGGPFSLSGVVGPMARTVDDVALLLSVMAGADIGDPNGHPVPLGRVEDVTAQDFVPIWSDGHTERRPQQMPSAVRVRLRVGWFDGNERTPVLPEIRDAVRASAQALADAGVECVHIEPEWLDEAYALWWEIFGRAVRLVLEPAVQGHEHEVHPNLVQFIEWTRGMPKLTAERLLAVETQRDALRTRVLAQMRDLPVLLCPVSAVAAFKHGEREWIIGGRRVHYLDAWSYSAWFNLLQNPAVAVPAGRTREGLPIGVQVVARHWEEHVALGVARMIERALGGYVPPPPTG